MRYSIILVVPIFFLLPTFALSATLKVPSQYPSIQDAIDAASGGDTVLVAPGTYVENIDFKGKAITVESEQGADVTVIDGGNPANPDFGSGVMFTNKEGSDSILDGFTITNGTGTYYSLFGVGDGYYGGGIFGNNASPIVTNNIIVNNTAAYCGAIFFDGTSPTITNNRCTINSGWVCIWCLGTYTTITHNEISGNASGGLCCCMSDSKSIVSNNIITNNGWGMDFFIEGISSNISITKNIVTHSSSYVGIYVGTSEGGSVIISNNIISDNQGPGIAGSFESSGSSIISNNLISENCASHGGGISCRNWDHSLMISDNIIKGNKAGGGGGILHVGSDNTHVTNNMIIENSADTGGGILIDGDSLKVTNCTISQNIAYYGGGIYAFSINGTLKVTNSILWNEAPNEIDGGSICEVTYSDVKGGYPGTGNIDSDPLFVDPNNGDFHLTYLSPCKDTGDNSAVTELTDFEGDPRTAYGTVDMGADEFYTHLYWTGDATPGGAIELKLVGLPGTKPVGLCIGTGVLDPPLKSMWGDWYLAFPIIGPVIMPSIPTTGVSIVPGTIPSTYPSPASVPMQALIGAELSNLSVLEVK